MSRLVAAVAFFGLVALASAAIDLSKAEWTGKAWLGVWESTGKDENLTAFAAALGPHGKAFGGNDKAIVKLWKAGDHYHQVIKVPSLNIKKEAEFKLGEELTIHHNNTEVKVTFTVHGDKLKAVIKIPSLNKEIKNIYEVTGDELVKTYKTGDITAKRWFKRLPNPAPPAK